MRFLSVVLQIILESLPFSSSGHAQLLALFLPDSIDRLVGGATVLVLVVYFRKDLIFWMRAACCEPKKICSFLLLIIMADSVTVFLYTLLKLCVPAFPLWFGFLITACVLFSLKLNTYNDVSKKINYLSFFVLGFVQGFACLPGISRLATTYATAAWFGYEPAIAFRLSCAVQIPLFTAGFFEGLHTVWHSTWQVSFWEIVIIIGSMICAYLLLWLVETAMKTRKIWYFGWYMLIPILVASIKGM